MKIFLAFPRGFCAGVERAIDTVEKAVVQYNQPIYVRHEIVHNRHVVEDLIKKGVHFVEELSEVPDDALVIFSAHGVAKRVYDEAKARGLKFIDATCPLVRKVHFSVAKYAKKNINIILIGHEDHVEVVGTMGQLEPRKVTLVQNIEDVDKLDFPPDAPLAYTTQTTLSAFEVQGIIQALKEKYPNIIGPDSGDLCYATTNRQKAVLEVIKKSEVMVIVGSKNSSNTTRLKEIASEHNLPSYMVNDFNDLHMSWFKGVKRIGISSGASAPEYLVEQIVKWFHEKFEIEDVEEILVTKENMHFPPPPQLRKETSPSF